MMEESAENNDILEENTVGGQNTLTRTSTTTAAPVCSDISTAPKEKRRWFSSLTRKTKSQSQISLVTTNSSFEAPLQSSTTLTIDNNNKNNSNNNSNNSSCNINHINDNNNPDEITPITDSSRKRKDEKNVFQKFLFQKFFSKKKIGIRFPILHLPFNDDEQLEINGTTDASAEFVTHSPARKPSLLTFRFMQSNNQNLLNNNININNNNNNNNQTLREITLDDTEIIPFTHDYKRFIAKKWLDTDVQHQMYKACCEMLNQVWYWGEISRRDAQKQLTDKSTGSFLVRDSETRGCQFTLSFRIVNVTLHYRLEYRDNYWHFEELQYESIVEMIEDILHRCTNDNFVCFVKVPNEVQPPFPVILKYPLSRYMNMPHLQDLCRRVIQRHVAQEEIINLPIPPKLLEYLGEPRELVFQS